VKPTKEQTRDKFTWKKGDVVILKQGEGEDERPPAPPKDPAKIKLPDEKLELL
jgi:hypothetical protein